MCQIKKFLHSKERVKGQQTEWWFNLIVNYTSKKGTKKLQQQNSNPRYCDSSIFVLFVQDLLSYLESFVFPYEFYGFLAL